MKLKLFIFLVFLNFNPLCFAQKENNIDKDFTSIFLNNYQELSKPPFANYFVVLNNTVKSSFSVENPFFKTALTDIENTFKINEEEALDSLFKKSFRYLRKNSIWISSPGILENEKDFFQVYNNQICPCLTSNVKENDRLDKMIEAQKSCFAKILFDSSFIKEIKAKGGNKTLNDISKLQSYFAMFFYENCDILNYKFNETLNNIAYEQYLNEVSKNKIEDVENLIKNYNANRFDSVEIFFPNYTKFKKQFEKISQLTAENETFNLKLKCKIINSFCRN